MLNEKIQVICKKKKKSWYLKLTLRRGFLLVNIWFFVFFHFCFIIV